MEAVAHSPVLPEAAVQVSDLRNGFSDASARAEALVRSAAPPRLITRPGPGRWSAAECLMHLNLTSKLYIPLIHTAVRQARQDGLEAHRAFRMDWKGKFLRWFLEPPYRMRGKTVAGAVPDRPRPPEAALAEFRALNDQLVVQLEEAGTLAMDEIRVASPFRASTTYSLYSAFHVLLAHERRHLWQAEQAVQAQ